MKTISISFIRCWLLLSGFMLPHVLWAQRLNFRQADSLLVTHNHDLKTARWDVSSAEGQLAQSRRYDNPTVNMMYNVRNPNTRRWFDGGYDGELDVQLSQPFAIGGQHAEQVRQNEALAKASRSQLRFTERDLRTQAHTMLIDLYYQQRQAGVYDVEIASVEKILAAYRSQSAKGNIAEMETQRIATMLYQLNKERTDLLIGVNDLQAQLRLLFGLAGNDTLTADINEAEAIDEASRIYLSLQGSGLEASVDSLPELQALTSQTEAARHALKWQHSQALPQMAVQGEYDKNGSSGHNFFAVGLSVAAHWWNHSRGKRRSAEAAVEQAAIAADRQRLAIKEQRQADLDIVGQYLRQLSQPSASLDTDMAAMLRSAEQQFMSRHITLMEFVDLYANYRDTMLARLDAKNKLLQAAERLKMMWGE